MPDKKLTDSEIVSLLKCCSKSNCYNCGYNKQCDGYTSANYALDLINRLQAENERLTIRLRKTEHQFDDAMKMYSIIKAEAYKEFDKQIKEDCLSYPLEKDDITMLVDVKNYNNLLKELVGGTNDE